MSDWRGRVDVRGRTSTRRRGAFLGSHLRIQTPTRAVSRCSALVRVLRGQVRQQPFRYRRLGLTRLLGVAVLVELAIALRSLLLLLLELASPLLELVRSRLSSHSAPPFSVYERPAHQRLHPHQPHHDRNARASWAKRCRSPARRGRSPDRMWVAVEVIEVCQQARLRPSIAHEAGER